MTIPVRRILLGASLLLAALVPFLCAQRESAARSDILIADFEGHRGSPLPGPNVEVAAGTSASRNPRRAHCGHP